MKTNPKQSQTNNPATLRVFQRMSQGRIGVEDGLGHTLPNRLVMISSSIIGFPTSEVGMRMKFRPHSYL